MLIPKYGDSFAENRSPEEAKKWADYFCAFNGMLGAACRWVDSGRPDLAAEVQSAVIDDGTMARVYKPIEDRAKPGLNRHVRDQILITSLAGGAADVEISYKTGGGVSIARIVPRRRFLASLGIEPDGFYKMLQEAESEYKIGVEMKNGERRLELTKNYDLSEVLKGINNLVHFMSRWTEPEMPHGYEFLKDTPLLERIGNLRSAFSLIGRIRMDTEKILKAKESDDPLKSLSRQMEYLGLRMLLNIPGEKMEGLGGRQAGKDVAAFDERLRTDVYGIALELRKARMKEIEETSGVIPLSPEAKRALGKPM